MQVRTTPLATSKTAALNRILDAIPKGYGRYVSGRVKREKISSLVQKFHDRYRIAASPAQRVTRKKHGLANVILVMLSQEGSEFAEWAMLATPGGGVEEEAWKDLTKERLVFAGYEIVRHASRGKTVWTAKRPKSAMADSYALLTDQLHRRRHDLVKDTLERAARQPGFHGVREQTFALVAFARQRGYAGPVPHIFFVQKTPHGTPIEVLDTPISQS